MMSLANAARSVTTSVAYVFALTVILACSATAQPEAPPELHIKLAPLCDVVQVSVVINGRDDPQPTEKIPACTWTLKDIGKYNLDISYFSLRIQGKGRTPCRRAKAIYKSNNILLDFTKTPTGKDRPDFEIAGPPLDYTREVWAISDSDVRCFEKGSLTATLSDVWFDIEKFHLRLFEKTTVACGVILNEAPALSKPKKGVGVPLTYKELVPMVINQGIKGENCYAPTVLPPEPIEDHLRRQAPLTITVK